MFEKIWLYIKSNWVLVSVWAGLFLVLLASILIICLDKQSEIVPPETEFTEEKLSSEIREEQYFPEKVLAPFIDMTSWIDVSNEYSLNGAPNLEKIKDETGLEYICLGFIEPDQESPLESDGTIRWCWGGYYDLSETGGKDGFQYTGIKDSINNFIANGGKPIISFGGQYGVAPWVASGNVDKLKQMYLEVIEAYDLKRIDLDIEEANQGESANTNNAKAIKMVQDKTNVEVVLTIPIMPNGWTTTQKTLLRTYLNAGVNIKLINSMTMCYGAGTYSGEDYGDASIRALQNAKEQLIAIYDEYGITLSEEEAYKKMGATVDIGFESSLYPTFTTEMTQKVSDFAASVGLGMLSYWSLNRDTLTQPNVGIDTKYEFLQSTSSFVK